MAKLRDYQRAIVEGRNSWPLQLKRFEFKDVPSLGADEFGFDTPLTILCGPNGVGKTTLLRAIWATASPDTYQSTPGTDLKLGAGLGRLEYVWNAQDRSAEQVFTRDNLNVEPETDAIDQFPVEVAHLDSSDRPTRLQTQFCAMGSFDEITNGVGAKELQDKELSEIRALCARNFRTITMFEIESGAGHVPFFDVAYGDDRYDSRTMGSGESAALFLWWSLGNLSNNALVLIEEPETYLSPASQEAFIHYLTGMAVKKKLVVIVSSHSPKIIQGVGDIHHAFIHRLQGKIKIDTGGASPQLLSTIGIETKTDVIILVEDAEAKTFAERILNRCKPELSRRSEIVIMDGQADITQLLKKTKDRIGSVQMVGLYDGDQRGKISTDVEAKTAFLPGHLPVEILFRNLVEQDIGISKVVFAEPRLSEIIYSLEGKDHHDWFAELAEALSLGKDQLFLQIFQMWLREDGAMEEALICVGEIETAITGSANGDFIESEAPILEVLSGVDDQNTETYVQVQEDPAD